jgi:hypothetical protein
VTRSQANHSSFGDQVVPLPSLVGANRPPAATVIAAQAVGIKASGRRPGASALRRTSRVEPRSFSPGFRAVPSRGS